MIIVGLMGGLGNQMFQYAAARRLAIHLGTELRLDITFHISNEGPETPRPYLLDRFAIEADVIKSNELRSFLDAGLPGYKHSLNSMASKLTGHKPFKNPKMFVETDKNFEPEVLELPNDRYLQGYFQSERYFRDVRYDILKEFTVRAPMDQRNKEMASKISATRSICMHVRRGDYFSNEVCQKVHGVDLTDYYRQAIEQMKERVDDCHFFLFSDEPEWVRDNLDLKDVSTVVDINSPGDPEQDLRLMSGCENFIIANSSFSWWGAWLSQNTDKVVIAPRRWFLDDRDVRDRCPEEWIRL